MKNILAKQAIGYWRSNLILLTIHRMYTCMYVVVKINFR